MPLPTRRLAAIALLATLIASPTLALAKKEGAGKTPRSGAGSRGVRLKPSPTATYASGESPAERQRNEDARLRRECHGRPNAGACLGYTR